MMTNDRFLDAEPRPDPTVETVKQICDHKLRQEDFKQATLNEIHERLRLLYAGYTRVEIAVTVDGMEITAYDRYAIKGYSMRRIDGTWVDKEPEITVTSVAANGRVQNETYKATGRGD